MIDAPDFLASLAWLRPGWLLALPAGLALMWAWRRARAGTAPWRRLVDADLLAQLVGRAPPSSGLLALGVAAMAFILACIALAGPAWRTQPAPLVRDQSARIVVLDLSRSMDAVDVAPSRLERARSAINVILRESGDAQLGLVVFGADAFTVAPLLNDASPLVHLLGSLGTATVPRAGSRPDLALEMARELLARARVSAGDVILVGDSAGDERALDAARELAKAGFPLSVLAVGTPHGGPVRLESGALAKSAANDIVIAVPELAALERLAQAGGGRYHLLAAGEEAPHFARGAQAWAAAPAAPALASRLRQDDGAWFVLLALPFAALLFRRGWLAGFAALAFALPAPQAEAQQAAFGWPDLWRRSDQQAAAEFSSGQFGEHAPLKRTLARLEVDSPWQAMLLYRSGRFADAAARFAAEDTADAHYNRGNALALEGRLEQALAAYGAALERGPSMRDALFNRALVREALAKRRAQGQGRAPAKEPQRARAFAPGERAGDGPDAHGRGANAARDAGQRGTPAGAAAGTGQAQPRADTALSPGASADAARPDDALDGPELRRLEGLLAEIPDNPGSMLANRFAWQLKLRGSWHHDTGARW